MWVGEEAHVEDVVDVERHPVLETEAEHQDLHVDRLAGTEQLGQALPELVHVEVARVDYHVGHFLDGPELAALVCYRSHDALFPQWVAPAGPLEPADQHLVRGLQEQHPYEFPGRFQLLYGGLKLAQLAGVAADHESQALRLGGGAGDELGHLVDKGSRDVVHDVPPDVLQDRTRL